MKETTNLFIRLAIGICVLIPIAIAMLAGINPQLNLR